MITAVFTDNSDYARATGLWQWDYGQRLRIEGLKLPTAIEIHFALTEQSGDAITRVGATKDGVTEVVIPDSLLENQAAGATYEIYAWIYLADKTSGETIKRISMQVKRRPKPEGHDTPEDAELFRDAIAQVNASADRAETAREGAEAAKKAAEAAAGKIEGEITGAGQIAEQVKQDAAAVADDRSAVSQLATETTQNAQKAAEAAQAAERSSTAAKEAQTAAESAKAGATAAMKEVERDRVEVSETHKAVEQLREAVDTDRQAVAADRRAVENTALQFGQAAQSAINAVGQAQEAAVGAVSAEGQRQTTAVQQAGTQAVSDVETAKTEAVQAVTTEGDTQTKRVQDAAAVGVLKEDLAYKINSRLTPVQFETVLGYYAYDGFVSGKKEWGARLMRVQCKKGDKYLYHGYCDNIYGVSFLDSDFRIIRQISVPENKEFEMDINAIDNASYIDFYSGHTSTKTYVLKYNREDTINNDVGKIFVDASSQLIETDDKYFSPTKEELVYGSGMKLKEITPENDTVFKFSFSQHQQATAYVDDFCIVTSGNYVNGTEVFNENIIVFVPKGKTLRINDFNSNVHVSKFEKLVPITEEYINKKTGLPYIAVASSEAPTAIKSVCQYVCDGTDDNIEIQNAINSLGSAGGKVFLTKGKFFISAPIDTGDTLVELCGEGALLDLHEDTLNSNIRGGTILQAVGNTDLVHIGGAKGTTVHDIAFFGYGRNKVDNTSFGIKFTGYADTDRIYNCGFTNCAIAIGSDITTDVVYIHNLSVQRNKIGIALYRTDAEIHDCIFCENIGMESVIWDNETYDINCSDVCINDGKIYNNTFRRSGMCYDIYKVYGNESGLESDDVKPISSVVVRQRAHIVENKFFDCIYANCIRIMMKPDFLLIEGNSFTKWGHKDQTDDCRKSAIWC